MHSRPRSGIALLNDDPFEDAIVVTALDYAPFCCHADLQAKNYDELVQVAHSLNKKLPKILSIDLTQSSVFIRNSIEVLVGIKPGIVTCATPKRSPAALSDAMNYKKKSLVRQGTPRLSRLTEEPTHTDVVLDSPCSNRSLARVPLFIASPTPRVQVRDRAPSLPLDISVIQHPGYRRRQG